ncbi:MAG: signal peptidase I [Actinomycetota bacterium]|nr:signal peptidase I [Actinomycetota bacterium]
MDSALPTPTLLTHALLTALGAVALLALAAFVLARPLGFRVLVDHSDSMAPAIRTGDLLVAKDIPPREARVGDVVSFHAPGSGRLLTHRVVERRLHAGGRWAFVTRGDANTGVERWSVSTRGTMGRVAVRLPKAGYAVAWLGQPIWAVLLVGGGGLLLAVLLARRIWSL